MDVSYLIQLLNNKLVGLQNAETQAVINGDIDSLNNIQTQILQVQGTISKLQLLITIESAATSANTTSTNVVASGIQAVQNGVNVNIPPTNLLDATSILASYNLSTYSTNPLYQQNLNSIISAMTVFNTASDIDTYIQTYAPGSPVTGQMILNAVSQYSVNQYLMIAMLQLESSFGMMGEAVATLNPGNVGNTDSGATQTFASWDLGVDAVADWLNNHRTV
jgi:hypothetical protein